MADIVIIGAGGQAGVVFDILRELVESGRILGFIDVYGEERLRGKELHGLPVLGAKEEIFKLRERGVKFAHIAIGDNQLRRRFFLAIKDAGLEPLTVAHPKSFVSRTAKIGSGTCISAGAIIGTGVSIGECVIVNTGAIIDHDCEIGSFCHIAPGSVLAGRVRIGERSFIGLGARISNNTEVGSDVIVGAGAVVLQNIPDGKTAVGVPAKFE
jgi:UDP-perosamine 4-acetyltransferase